MGISVPVIYVLRKYVTRIDDMLDEVLQYAKELERRTWRHPLAVYVIEEDGATYCKVGICADDNRRRRELQLGNPRPLSVALFRPIPNPRRVEAMAHSLLFSAHVGGEWFKCARDKAIEAVERAIEASADLSDDDFDGASLIGGWSPSHQKLER